MSEYKLSDQWMTPTDLFNVLDKGGIYQRVEFKGFNFDIDLCATAENSKCNKFCNDYLNQKYYTEHFMKNLTCWMNPPYSNPKPFIEKAWEDSKYCKIVCLVKCDPSTKWWAVFWNYEEHREVITDEYGDVDYIDWPIGPKPGCDVRFFKKRIAFDPPQQLIDNGEVWKRHSKWVKMCTCVNGVLVNPICIKCKGRGNIKLSGPTFPSALLIFDRRGL